MNAKRRIEVFTAGCTACKKAVDLVRKAACPSCEVTILDMHDSRVARRASRLGIRSIPAVVVDGTLASCCAGAGLDLAALRLAGLGRPRAPSSHRVVHRKS